MYSLIGRLDLAIDGPEGGLHRRPVNEGLPRAHRETVGRPRPARQSPDRSRNRYKFEQASVSVVVAHARDDVDLVAHGQGFGADEMQAGGVHIPELECGTGFRVRSLIARPDQDVEANVGGISVRCRCRDAAVELDWPSRVLRGEY